MQHLETNTIGLIEIPEHKLNSILGGHGPKGEISGSVTKTDGQPATGEIKVTISWPNTK